MVFENRKVPCIGCKEDVNRSDAEFCLLDNGLYCYFCKDCIQKIQKENSPQKNPPREKKKETDITEETDLTEISKFEWKEKTCEDIIEDMRKIRF
jgi:hypothetical protein